MTLLSSFGTFLMILLFDHSPLFFSSLDPNSSSTGQSPSSPPSPSSGSSSSSHTGAIVGAVVGGLLGAALIAACLFLFLRSRRRSRSGPREYNREGWDESHLYTESAQKFVTAPTAYAIELNMSDAPAPAPMENLAHSHGQVYPQLQTGILSPSSVSTAPSHNQRQDSYATTQQSPIPYPQIPSFPPGPPSGGESLYGGVYPNSVRSGPTAASMSIMSPGSRSASVMSPARTSIATSAGFAGLGAASANGGHPVPARSRTDSNSGTASSGSEFRRDARLKQIGALDAQQRQPSTPHSDSNGRSLPLPPSLPQTSSPEQQQGSQDMLGLTTHTDSPVRYERDFGMLESASPPPHELIMPPEYEDARQPWERRRDDM